MPIIEAICYYFWADLPVLSSHCPAGAVPWHKSGGLEESWGEVERKSGVGFFIGGELGQRQFLCTGLFRISFKIISGSRIRSGIS